MHKKTTIPAFFLIIIIFGISISAYIILDIDKPYLRTNPFPNSSFINPIGVYPVPDDDSRLLVLERQGIIYQIATNRVETKNVFLNLSSRTYEQGSELGMLGFVFHPQYAINHEIFVFYTELDPNRNNITDNCNPCTNSILARFHVDQKSNIVNYDSEEILMVIPQLSMFHKAGHIHFGSDNYLYVYIGEDTRKSGQISQDLTTYYGKILRIDVDHKSPGFNYSIPASNPFYDNNQSYKEEIYAYGLRNPWRGGFDPVTNILWVVDVGESLYEEINIIESGKNYGWNIWEGPICHNEDLCINESLILENPFFAYPHAPTSNPDQPHGPAIVGSVIYRGDILPSLQNQLIIADFHGSVWSISFDHDNLTIIESKFITRFRMNLHGISLDHNNELLFVGADPKTGEGYIYGIKNNIF